MFDNLTLQPDSMVDSLNPINDVHQLNKGLVADYSCVTSGGLYLRNLKGTNHGTLSSGAKIGAGHAGLPGIDFNGTSNARVNCGRIEAIMAANATVSISMWVYRRSNVTGGLIGPRQAGVASWVLGYHTTGQLWLFDTVFRESLIFVELNKWTHVAVTVKGTAYQFYKNGQFVSQVTGVGLPAAGLPAFVGIGAWDSGGSGPSNCIMDGITIHNRQLMHGEVSELYHESINGNPSRWNWVSNHSLSNILSELITINSDVDCVCENLLSVNIDGNITYHNFLTCLLDCTIIYEYLTNCVLTDSATYDGLIIFQTDNQIISENILSFSSDKILNLEYLLDIYNQLSTITEYKIIVNSNGNSIYETLINFSSSSIIAFDNTTDINIDNDVVLEFLTSIKLDSLIIYESVLECINSGNITLEYFIGLLSSSTLSYEFLLGLYADGIIPYYYAGYEISFNPTQLWIIRERITRLVTEERIRLWTVANKNITWRL
jgi:hypothetical protein